MQAVICGGGPDALTLAIQLGRRGWSVLMLPPAFRRGRSGYLVELAHEGLAAIQELGLLSELLKFAECISRVHWLDARGRPIADIEADDESEEPVHVLREDLQHLLLQALPSTVSVRRGLDVLDVVSSADSVAITLSSGEQLKADLLIGADGGHSRIRKLVFGTDGLWHRPLGYHSVAFLFEDVEVHRRLAGRLTVLSAPNRFLSLSPLRSGQVAATFAYRSAAQTPPRQPLDSLRMVFKDLKWCVPTVLEHAARAKELHHDWATQIKTTTWHRGRIALLGDACYTYSMLPGHGCGASLAAASWLGSELAQEAYFDAAFSAYEADLAREISTRREAARRVSRWLMPNSRTDLVVRNSLLRVACLPGMRRFVRPATSLSQP